jgi:membrane-bound lytic murein transglycosylase D
MEPRTIFGALRLIVEVNVLLCGALLLARTIAARSGGSRRQRLRCAQAAFVLAFALPVTLRALPHRPLLPAAAQVWSGGDVGRPTTASATYVGTTWRAGRREVSIDNRALALLLAGLGAAAVARILWLVTQLFILRRSLDALPSIRRIGRTSVVATSSEHVPFSAWLFGRAYVAIPETLVAVDTPHYAIAIRHELAHHRQRDTIWIQVFEAASALTFWNPATHAWSRLFTELMELACDEALVVGRRVDARAYAECLADAARAALTARRPSHVLATTQMATVNESFLRRRIDIMLAPRITPHHASVFALFVTLLVLASSAFALQNALQDRVIGADQARELAARAQASDFPVVINDQVLERINRLVGTPAGREFIQGALQRMPDYRAVIEQRLAENGMPSSLIAVALVESGFRNDDGLPSEPTLTPDMRGAGIWMFVPETARRYGLSVQPSRRIDERLDVAKETDAAIAYLEYLHRQFADWHLALAAYNQGESHVARAIGETGSRDPFALAKEGRLNDYLATVMAGVVILANPQIVW